jgi:hypothetical protein
MEQVDGKFAFRVRKGTHVSILALINPVRVGLTKLDLVLLWMIEFFHSIVRLAALVAKGALACAIHCYKGTDLT